MRIDEKNIKKAKNIALFGGSFDPFHNGHKAIVESIVRESDIELLIVMPTFLNPFKDSTLFSPQDRIKMAKLVVDSIGNEKISLSDFEIKNGRKTPTIESVEHIKKTYSPERIYLIIGEDNLESIHMWSEFERLKNIVGFIIAKRGDYGKSDSLQKRYNLIESIKISRVLEPSFDVSSREIRERISLGLDIDDMIPSEILKFVEIAKDG